MKKLATFLTAGFLAFAGMPDGYSGKFGIPTVEAVGTTILEGSDATGFHFDSTYTSQLFFFMAADSYNSALPILVWNNDFATVDLSGSGAPASTQYVTSLAAIPTLVGVYSAIYIQSPFGCCDENLVTDASEIAKINALTAAGGSLSIQNYQGLNSAILGFTPAPLNVAGFDTAGGGPGCFDSEIFLPNALAAGFTQPPVLGCWGHQAYDNAFFGPLGFATLVDSGPEFASLGSGSWSSFLAKGGTLGEPIPAPEPASIVLLGFGLAGSAFARLRRKKK